MTGRLVIGLVLIGAGLSTAVFYRSGARRGAQFHNAWARVLPWIYGRGYSSSEKSWRGPTLIGGILLVVLGGLYFAGIAK